MCMMVCTFLRWHFYFSSCIGSLFEYCVFLYTVDAHAHTHSKSLQQILFIGHEVAKIVYFFFYMRMLFLAEANYNENDTEVIVDVING